MWKHNIVYYSNTYFVTFRYIFKPMLSTLFMRHAFKAFASQVGQGYIYGGYCSRFLLMFFGLCILWPQFCNQCYVFLLRIFFAGSLNFVPRFPFGFAFKVHHAWFWRGVVPHPM